MVKQTQSATPEMSLLLFFLSALLLFFTDAPNVKAGDPALRTPVAMFSSGSLEGWEKVEFSGLTSYQLVSLQGESALRAEAIGTASGLVRKMTVDLEKTPYLNWSWRVEGALPGLEERTREGDDYAARIYVVLSGGVFFWKTRAMNYVWSGSQPAGASWKSAFTDGAMMVAVRSAADAGRWQREKRNIREDFRRFFGIKVTEINAVALMTDTDQSGQFAEAWYGDIFFSAE